MITPADSAEKVNRPGAGRYFFSFLSLVLLTGLTFGLSTVELGAWSLAVALTIAVTKASIIAPFFMHLRDHEGASRLVLIIAVIFVAVLSLLVVADALTRFPGALPSLSPSSRIGGRRRALPRYARPLALWFIAVGFVLRVVGIVSPRRFYDGALRPERRPLPGVSQTFGVKFGGRFAWLAWLTVNLWYLIGSHNRAVVRIRWPWPR